MSLSVVRLFQLCSFLLLWMDGGLAQQFSSSFLVTFFDDRILVVSPKEYHTPVSVIIDNQSTINIIGRVEGLKKGQTPFIHRLITVEKKKNVSLDIPVVEGERLQFVTLAPPLTEVDLKFGREQFRIPPKID